MPAQPHTEEEELEQLLEDIQRVGVDGEPRVTFGELFVDPQVEQYYEALVGTLKMAKKRGLVEFEGQVLFKGVHDKVVIAISQSLLDMEDGQATIEGPDGERLVIAVTEDETVDSSLHDSSSSSSSKEDVPAVVVPEATPEPVAEKVSTRPPESPQVVPKPAFAIPLRKVPPKQKEENQDKEDKPAPWAAVWAVSKLKSAQRRRRAEEDAQPQPKPEDTLQDLRKSLHKAPKVEKQANKNSEKFEKEMQSLRQSLHKAPEDLAKKGSGSDDDEDAAFASHRSQLRSLATANAILAESNGDDSGDEGSKKSREGMKIDSEKDETIEKETVLADATDVPISADEIPVEEKSTSTVSVEEIASTEGDDESIEEDSAGGSVEEEIVEEEIVDEEDDDEIVAAGAATDASTEESYAWESKSSAESIGSHGSGSDQESNQGADQDEEVVFDRGEPEQVTEVVEANGKEQEDEDRGLIADDPSPNNTDADDDEHAAPLSIGAVALANLGESSTESESNASQEAPEKGESEMEPSDSKSVVSEASGNSWMPPEGEDIENRAPSFQGNSRVDFTGGVIRKESGRFNWVPPEQSEDGKILSSSVLLPPRQPSERALPNQPSSRSATMARDISSSSMRESHASGSLQILEPDFALLPPALVDDKEDDQEMPKDFGDEDVELGKTRSSGPAQASRRRCLLLVIVCLIIVAAAVVVPLLILRPGKKDSDDDPAPTTSERAAATPSTAPVAVVSAGSATPSMRSLTSAPSFAPVEVVATGITDPPSTTMGEPPSPPPTPSPSASPSAASAEPTVSVEIPETFPRLVEFIAVEFPEGGPALADETSPQYQALMWIFNRIPNNEGIFSDERYFQRYALMTLYYGTSNNGGWNNDEGWATSAHECAWEQTSSNLSWHCDENGNIRDLNLSNNNLVGEIPPEIFLLRDGLVSLDLSNNGLFGDIPSIIGSLSNLEVLRLSDNDLGGTIPTEMSLLESLVTLELERNNIGPSLPSGVCSLSNLTSFSSDCSEIGGCSCCTLCCFGDLACIET